MRVTIETSGLSQAVAALTGARPRLHQLWARELFAGGARGVGIIRREFRGAAETSPIATRVRTGRLRGAYSHEVKQDSTGASMTLGVLRPPSKEVLRYAAAHEFGATIRPRPGGALAIPLPAALTAAGVLRAQPRDWPNTFIAKGIIFQKQPGAPLALFILRRRPVVIPARPALAPTAERIAPEIAKNIADKSAATILGFGGSNG